MKSMLLDEISKTGILSLLAAHIANQHGVVIELIDNSGNILFRQGKLPFLCQIIQNRDKELARQNYVLHSSEGRFDCEGGLRVISKPFYLSGQVSGYLVAHGIKTDLPPKGFGILSEQINVEEQELHEEYHALNNLSEKQIDVIEHQLDMLAKTLPALCVQQIKDEKKIRSLSSFQKLHGLLSSTTDFEKVINSMLSFLVTELPFTHVVVHLLDFQQAFISSPLPGPREEIEARIAKSMGDYSQTISSLGSDFSMSSVEGIENFEKSLHAFPVVSNGQRTAIFFCYGPESLVLTDIHRELLEVVKFRFNDIIIKHLELESAQRSAITDKLTTLFNRRYFNDRLSLELAEANEVKGPISLIMVDLDHFKKLNDTFGHQKGDEVLQSFGSIIKSVLRRSDIPCRYGGEEFAIILSHTGLADAKNVAERLREAAEKFDFGHIEETRPVTCSVGLATCSNGSVDAHILLKEADAALYRAKNLGRNRVECSLIVDRNMGSINVNDADELYIQKNS